MDISGSASVVSKKIENNFDDNKNFKSRNILVKLRKSSQNDNLDKLQPTKKISDPTSVCGLLINIFFCLLFCSLKLQLLLKLRHFYLNNTVLYYWIKYDYWKYKFKYSLIKDPSKTSSLEYIKQQIKQYISTLF